MRPSRALRAALLSTTVVAAACGPRDAPNVVIIAIDTLRADHLGCYGYPRPTSPRIDALAAEGVVFQQAISQSPWTLPSFASILTGVIPQRHGAGQGKLCLNRPCRALSSDQATLAELMSRAGYRTASFVSNGFVSSDVGLGRGFDVAENTHGGAAVMTKSLAWLEAHRGERVFLFAHLIEPHLPYEPPPADAAPFVDPAYAGQIGMRVDREGGNPGLDDADRRRIVDLYDGEIHFADRLVGQLLDALDRLDLARRTLVVVVSDHGEELLERGTLGHGHSLYDELVHVPLVVRFPDGGPRGRVARQVRAMDVFPTVLEVAGVPIPGGLDAVSLVGAARGERPPAAADLAIAEFTFTGPELRGLRTAGQKLVLDRDRGTARLFDLSADPRETADVAAEMPDRAALLRAALDATETHGDPGLYVLVHGGSRAQRVRVVLNEPVNGFSKAYPMGLEDEDTVTIAPDGHTVTIDLAVAADDADGVRLPLMLFGPSITVTELSVDGKPWPQQGLFLGTAPASRVPAALLPSSVAVPHAMPPRAQASVQMALQAVQATPRSTLALDPKTVEQLRALGYAQ